MARIEWTPQALEDISVICEYITRDSKYYAHYFVDKIFEKADNLVLFPEAGRIVPEINRKNIREIFHGNYRIIYRIKNEIVEILTVYHGARIFDLSFIDKIL